MFGLNCYLQIQGIIDFINQGSVLSLFGGVAVSFLSAILVYSARQVWEKRKLRRALLTEINEMEGIETCADQMERNDPPPGRQIYPDDVPAVNSIPTTVYRSTAGRIGLLGGILGSNDLEGVVKFYSKVIRYKSIMRMINDKGVSSLEEGEDAPNSIPVSDNDQQDLYNNIGALSEVRDRITESDSFDVEYPDELE